MRRRGFSLLELVVALGLGAIVLAVLSQAVVPLTRQILAGFQEMEVAREAAVIDGSWERDLSLTPYDGREFSAARWVLRPLQDQPVGGDRAYGKQLVVYELVSGVLARREVEVPGLPLQSAARGQWVLTGPGGSRRLATGVSAFTVTPEGSTVVLDAALERMASGRRLSYRLHRVYGSRNP